MSILKNIAALAMMVCFVLGAAPSVAMSVSHYAMQERMNTSSHGENCENTGMELMAMDSESCCAQACSCAKNMCSSPQSAAIFAVQKKPVFLPPIKIESFIQKLTQSIHYQANHPPRT